MSKFSSGSGIGRRRLIRGAGLGLAGLALAYTPAFNASRLICMDEVPPPGKGFGPLVRDPKGMLDLPAGFSYKIIARRGQIMDDGFRIPGNHDGTGVLSLADGSYRLLIDHEVAADQPHRSPYPGNERPPEDKVYDPVCFGGVTAIDLSPNLEVKQTFLRLAGTERNCSGVMTQWGTWLSTEESYASPGGKHNYQKPHGFVFEVPGQGDGLATPKPLPALGRFQHEGIARDPEQGTIYMTEDTERSCFYKFEPDVQGDLSSGKLFALRIIDAQGVDTSNRGKKDDKKFTQGETVDVDWVELTDPDPEGQELRYIARKAGAASFSRGEGATWHDGGVVFNATNGGPRKLGQVWRFQPGMGETGNLKLLSEPRSECKMNMPDNAAVQPNGDLLLTEDNFRYTRLLGLTPQGTPYPFAYFRHSSREELAGIVYSPDGRFLYVGAYEAGLSFLIEGPFMGT